MLAECRCHQGRDGEALEWLNLLRSKRIECDCELTSGTPRAAATASLIWPRLSSGLTFPLGFPIWLIMMSAPPFSRMSLRVGTAPRMRSRATLIGEQPNPWNLLQPQDVTSRHRGAKPLRRFELLGAISLLSPEYLLSYERWPSHEEPPDHFALLSYLLDLFVSQSSPLLPLHSPRGCHSR